jgi:hypothetical protein
MLKWSFGCAMGGVFALVMGLSYRRFRTAIEPGLSADDIASLKARSENASRLVERRQAERTVFFKEHPSFVARFGTALLATAALFFVAAVVLLWVGTT